MDGDKTRREKPAVNDDKDQTPPVDRDQAAYSAPVAQDKADQAEFSKTRGAQKKPEPDDSLIARDNMKSGPSRSGS